jgi:hypothetical protein
MKRRRRRKAKGVGQEIPKLKALEQINYNAAGIDVGDDEMYVAVPEGLGARVQDVHG